MNIVTAKEVALTAKHVALIMEFAAGGNMTAYVAKKSQNSGAAAEGQLFMTEDEARYFYRVRGRLEGDNAVRQILENDDGGCPCT